MAKRMFDVLGPLEAEIMQIMWRDQVATVKDVHRQLVEQREIAYTTVMTTMGRLAEKGILTISGERSGRGAAYLYTVAVSRHDLAVAAARSAVAELLDGDSSYLVAALSQPNPLVGDRC